MGFKFYHGYTLLRKNIKQSLKKSCVRSKKKMTKHNANSIIALYGWAKNVNSYRLIKKYYKPVEVKYNIQKDIEKLDRLIGDCARRL